MTEGREPSEDLRDLAEQAMQDKRDETGSEAQVRELYDVPTESAADLADDQREST